MGAKHTKFEEGTMDSLLASTSLNRTEIYHAFRQFRAIYEQYVPPLDQEMCPLFIEEGYNNPEVSLPTDYIIDNMPLLKANPLSGRMCEVFAGDKEGQMCFLEFLDMISAFSPKSSLQVRMVYAFRVYDLDGDGVISRKDMDKVLDLLTDTTDNNDQKWEATKRVMIDGVFKEVNKNQTVDGLSREDFGFAVSKSPDFVSTFSFRI